jgi:PKD repeat protein
MASADEILAEEAVVPDKEQTKLPLFKIDFTVELFSSEPVLTVTLTPEFYGSGKIAETDIVNWKWNFADGREENTAAMIPISTEFETSGEYLIQLTACTNDNVCETVIKNWDISPWGVLNCLFPPGTQPTIPPTPAPSIPENPKIEFITTTAGTQFKAGPVSVFPNTVVQFQVSALKYDIVQVQWDYGDGTSSGWVPADKNKKTSHTYTTPGVYKPVVTVLNLGMGIRLSSEDLDRHIVVVQNEPVTLVPSPTPTPEPTLTPTPNPTPTPEPTPTEIGSGYLPLPNMKGPQADLNEDGFIDDFDGDGKINSFDIIVFLEAYMRGYLSPVSAYDYNQNEKLDLQDVIVFYDRWGTLNALANG